MPFGRLDVLKYFHRPRWVVLLIVANDGHWCGFREGRVFESEFSTATDWSAAKPHGRLVGNPQKLCGFVCSMISSHDVRCLSSRSGAAICAMHDSISRSFAMPLAWSMFCLKPPRTCMKMSKISVFLAESGSEEHQYTTNHVFDVYDHNFSSVACRRSLSSAYRFEAHSLPLGHPD